MRSQGFFVVHSIIYVVCISLLNYFLLGLAKHMHTIVVQVRRQAVVLSTGVVSCAALQRDIAKAHTVVATEKDLVLEMDDKHRVRYCVKKERLLRCENGVHACIAQNVSSLSIRMLAPRTHRVTLTHSSESKSSLICMQVAGRVVNA